MIQIPKHGYSQQNFVPTVLFLKVSIPIPGFAMTGLGEGQL